MTALAHLLKEYAAPASSTSGLSGYDLEGQRQRSFRAALRRALRLKKGDVAGHEFHGNQWVSVDSLIDQVPGGAYPLGANEVAIRRYRKEFRTGNAKHVEPIQVHARRGKVILDDGHHRVVAAYREGVKRIRATFSKLLKQQLTDRAAHAAATSYLNLKPQPTEAQRHAGNYELGHLKIHGLDVSIENPAGSHRRPEWPELKSHYGYIRRTTGADGDHVDCFVRVGTAEDYAGHVYVVNQVKADGSFDEHKAVIGHETPEGARQAYLENFPRGWTGLGSMVSLSMQDFKAWLAAGDTTKLLAKGDLPGHEFHGNQWTGGSAAPSGEIGHFSPEKGGLLFHGTREATGKFKEGHTFTTLEYGDAKGFAEGAHLGGRGNKPTVMMYQAKPGKTVDVNEHVMDMIMNGDLSEEKGIYDRARAGGARYATFTHPSPVADADNIVVVSLYPHQDLKSRGGWRVGKLLKLLTTKLAMKKSDGCGSLSRLLHSQVRRFA